MTNKTRFGGKLNIDINQKGICHNYPEKKACDNCMGCFDEHCDGSYCDAHNRCQCIRTECTCLGR